MTIRVHALAILAIIVNACAPLTEEISKDVATEIGTEVQVQVGTAAVEQVATAVATHFPEASARPGAAQPEFDCAPKYCRYITTCEEAVYKLTVCGQKNLDGNDDGVPCQDICSEAQVEAITAKQSDVIAVDENKSGEGGDEVGKVIRVIDGDTIDVLLDGRSRRVRYLQMNTPERDQPCSSEATQANAALVAGKTVRLAPDKELVDRYDRLLRHVYVGDVLVNRVLVEDGFAEVVLYPPNDAHYEDFKRLEREAAAAGRGCHPTGIFDDGSYSR